MTQIKEYKNGAYVTFEKESYWYITKCYDPSGNLLDKMRCDSYSAGREYFRAFCAIAKNR